MRIILGVFLLFLSSCGLFRKVDKHQESREEKTSVKLDSVASNEVIIKDKSKTVIEEKGKGTVKPPPIIVDWFTPFDQDSIIRTIFLKTETGTVSIVASLNKLGTGIDQTATFDPDPVDFDIDKTTTIENDIETSGKSKIDLSKNVSDSSKEATKDVHKEANNTILNWIGLGLLIVIVGVAFWKIVLEK